MVRPTGIEPASWVLEARDNPSCPRTQKFGEGVRNRTPSGRFWRPLMAPANFTRHRRYSFGCSAVTESVI